MTRVLKIIDSGGVIAGTSGISLIDPATIIGTKGGLNSLSLSADQIDMETPANEVGENLKVNLYGSSQDNAASQYQTLKKMLRKARKFWSSQWQTAPVYLHAAHANETGMRYAIVKGARGISLPDLFDAPFEVDARIDALGLDIIREHPWRGSIPGTLPTALTLTKTSGTADSTEVHVVNLGSAGTGDAISHIFNYDSSLTTFSTNQVAATGITLWSVSGATPAAGDIVYLGFATRPGFNVVMPLATAGVFSADVIIEAYISAAWTALTLGTNFWFYPALTSADQDNVYKTTGENVISFAPGVNWQTTAINGITAYWVRARLNSVSSWTTTPVSHASQTPYTQRRNYFDASASVIGGDAPPRMNVRLTAPTSGIVATPSANRLSAIFCGAKAGTSFESILNLHQYELPSGWAVAMGTDTTEATDTRAPSARRSACSFGASTSMVARVTLTGTSKWSVYQGTYRVILLCEQTSGDAGTTKVKVRVLQGGSGATNPYIDTKTVKLQGVDLGYELVDLGNVSIAPDVVSADSLSDDLVLQVFAERTSGAGTIRFSRLVLIPVDVFFFKAWMDSSNATLHLLSDEAIDVDFSVLADRTQKYRRSGANYVPGPKWFRSASVRRIEPATQYRFYCLMAHYPSTFGTPPLLVSAGSHLALSLYAVNSYLALRGGG